MSTHFAYNFCSDWAILQRGPRRSFEQSTCLPGPISNGGVLTCLGAASFRDQPRDDLMVINLDFLVCSVVAFTANWAWLGSNWSLQVREARQTRKICNSASTWVGRSWPLYKCLSHSKAFSRYFHSENPYIALGESQHLTVKNLSLISQWDNQAAPNRRRRRGERQKS